jgi:hypothetical protein
VQLDTEAESFTKKVIRNATRDSEVKELAAVEPFAAVTCPATVRVSTENERIPGAAPSWLARTLIDLFAAPDDPRRELIPGEHPVFAHKSVRVYRETRDPGDDVWH